jgi:hypothetical protein
MADPITPDNDYKLDITLKRDQSASTGTEPGTGVTPLQVVLAVTATYGAAPIHANLTKVPAELGSKPGTYRASWAGELLTQYLFDPTTKAPLYGSIYAHLLGDTYGIWTVTKLELKSRREVTLS